MMKRPVHGWCGWVLSREFDAEYTGRLDDVEETRDPEGRLLKRARQ